MLLFLSSRAPYGNSILNSAIDKTVIYRISVSLITKSRIEQATASFKAVLKQF